MTIDDVEHYTEDEKKKIIASYPAHEARGPDQGHPCIGLWPNISRHGGNDCHRPMDFPSHWPRIGGMDFGWDHPFAAVELVWDRDTDTVYVSRTHRLKEASPITPRCCAACLGQGIALGLAA